MVFDGEGPVAARCAEFVAQAPVAGASFTVVGSEAAQELIWGSDDVSRALAHVQYTLGEGPAMTAMAEHRPVLIGDRRGALDRWPFFAQEIAGLPVGALFVFPLHLGGATVGVCDSYATEAGLPSKPHLNAMLRALDRVTAALLGSAAGGAEGLLNGSGTGDSSLSDGPRAVVHQATGMVSVHLGIDLGEAFTRLRAYAYARGQLLHEAATDVVHGGVRLDEESGT